MTDIVVTALAALVTAVLVAFWQVGGLGALTRRTIKQELDIADALAPSPAQSRLQRLATERATLYVYAQTTRGLSRTARRRVVVLSVAAPLLFFGLFSAWAYTPVDSPSEDVVSVSLVLDILLMGALLGFWVGHVIFVRWAGDRRERDVRIATDAIKHGE